MLTNLITIFCLFLFQILKKRTHESQNTWHNFLLIPFSNIKKEYLQILKNLTQFFAHLPFQILKKHTYKSQNTLFHNNKNFKGSNSHKNHYTNNSYKNYYTNR